MIQRSFLRNAAAISRPLRSPPRSSSPSLASFPARTISSPLQRRTATSRWYSTPVEPDGKADTNSATSQPQPDTKEEAAEEEEEELSPLEKDIKKKEREIIDLKVGPPRSQKKRPPSLKDLWPLGYIDGLTNVLFSTRTRTDTFVL